MNYPFKQLCSEILADALLSCEPSSASHSSIAGGKKCTFYISLPTAAKTLEKALEEFLPFLPPTGQEYEVHIVLKQIFNKLNEWMNYAFI